MKKEYVECRVTVTEAFELNWYPGFCKAVFLDTEGKEHIITDKLPVIGLEDEEVEYLPLQKSIRLLPTVFLKGSLSFLQLQQRICPYQKQPVPSIWQAE